MRKSFIALLVLFLMVASCSPKYSYTKVLKPKKHIFSYDPKWHKKANRTHYVKLKH